MSKCTNIEHIPKVKMYKYYTLRLYFPYVSLLAQPVNIYQLWTFYEVHIQHI